MLTDEFVLIASSGSWAYGRRAQRAQTMQCRSFWESQVYLCCSPLLHRGTRTSSVLAGWHARGLSLFVVVREASRLRTAVACGLPVSRLVNLHAMM